jgi:acetyl esterase
MSSTLLPEIERTLLAGVVAPVDLELPVPQLRALCDAGVVATHPYVRPPVVSVEAWDERTATAAGDIPVRIYRPDVAEIHGVHVHLHGGGWWMGSIATADAMARELAAASKLLVVSVGYRLAPEHPWPAGAEDAFAATAWIHEQLPRLVGNDVGVTIGGESAGANLAAVVALMARDRGGPPLLGQWLDIPAVDLTFPQDASFREFGAGYGLDVAHVAQMLQWYLPDADPRHPYVSPAHADLRDLPPALITTAECDPVRDQGERYADQLEAAGVLIHRRRSVGHVHASTWLTALTRSAASWHEECVTWLRELHNFGAQS